MNIDPAELERLASRAFRQLPEPRAPRTLIARVLAAAALDARRPWYARAWRTWPAVWQVASAAAVVLLAVAGAVVIPGALTAARDVAPALEVPVPSRFSGSVRSLQAVWDAAIVVWRLVLEPVVPFVALFVLVMSSACVAFGTALDRVAALGGATKS